MAAATVSLKSNNSETIAAYLCSTCKNKNTETEAKAYCKKCDYCFCEECVNLHCQLFQNHTNYGPKEIEKWPCANANATQKFLENCEVHKGKKLTLFCEDHSQLCCNSCGLLYHKQCLKVTMVADTTLSATDLQPQVTKIQTIIDQLMKLQTNWESNMKSLQVVHEEQLKELARLSDAIHDIGKINQELAYIACIKSEEMMKQAETYLHNNGIQTELSTKLVVYTDI